MVTMVQNIPLLRYSAPFNSSTCFSIFQLLLKINAWPCCRLLCSISSRCKSSFPDRSQALSKKDPKLNRSDSIICCKCYKNGNQQNVSVVKAGRHRLATLLETIVGHLECYFDALAFGLTCVALPIARCGCHFNDRPVEYKRYGCESATVKFFTNHYRFRGSDLLVRTLGVSLCAAICPHPCDYLADASNCLPRI